MKKQLSLALLLLITMFGCNTEKKTEPTPDDLTTKPPTIVVNPIVNYQDSTFAPVVYIGDTAKFRVKISSKIELAKLEVIKYNNLEGTGDGTGIWEKTFANTKTIDESFSHAVTKAETVLFKLKLTGSDGKSILYEKKKAGESAFLGYEVTEVLDTVGPFKIYKNSGSYNDPYLFGSVTAFEGNQLFEGSNNYPRDFKFRRNPNMAQTKIIEYITGNGLTKANLRIGHFRFTISSIDNVLNTFKYGWGLFHLYEPLAIYKKTEFANFIQTQEIGFDLSTPSEIEKFYYLKQKEGNHMVPIVNIGDVYVCYLHDQRSYYIAGIQYTKFNSFIIGILKVKKIEESYLELEMRVINQNRFRNNR